MATVNLRTEQNAQRYYAALFHRDPTKGDLSFTDWFQQHIVLSAWNPRRSLLAVAVMRAWRFGIYRALS